MCLSTTSVTGGISPDQIAIAKVRFSADHYTGITDNWNQGIIHCSPVTAKLVIHLLGVKPEYLKPLAMDTEHHIQGALQATSGIFNRALNSHET